MAGRIIARGPPMLGGGWAFAAPALSLGAVAADLVEHVPAATGFSRA
ncbi:MAG TPA: hypothetical protein VGR43_06070 [Dehalococcoidia bacterium]|nr:hypothetical protein [Dehalococcoidia bacterium]